MSDTLTQYFQLVKPAVGASRDTWGAKQNGNLDVIDEFMFYATPVGAIMDFAGPQAPPGWLICDGRLVSRTTYSALFAVIGTYWGAGDGSTTFALPNPAGRAAVGAGTVIDGNGTTLSLSFTQTLGNVSNQLQQAHMPNYAIVTDVQGTHSHSGATAPGGNHAHTTDQQGSHFHPGAYLPSHTHPGGYTDQQGNHSHYVYEVWGNTAFGPNFGGGAYSAQGTGYFGGYTDTEGQHYHNLQVAAAPNLALTIGYDGVHAHNTTYSGNLQLGIYPDGAHQHTIYLGGSGALFSIMQPIVVVTKIIYAGQQAVAFALGVAPSPAVQIEGVAIEAEDELAAIREELAQLRAELRMQRNPPHPRRLSAPLRGPH